MGHHDSRANLHGKTQKEVSVSRQIYFYTLFTNMNSKSKTVRSYDLPLSLTLDPLFPPSLKPPYYLLFVNP